MVFSSSRSLDDVARKLRTYPNPTCPVLTMGRCPCGQRYTPVTMTRFRSWWNSRGEVNPNWEVIDHKGLQGYCYENEGGNFVYVEGNGAQHMNTRTGLFVCKTPQGDEIFVTIHDYAHRIVNYGPFRVVAGERQYTDPACDPRPFRAAR